MFCLDKSIFVQNIKKACQRKGVKPTVACRESGVGTSFINNIEARGQIPSVEKVQMLADYLGVTTSELLGEIKNPAPGSEGGSDDAAQRFMPLVDKLTPDQQHLLLAQLQAWTAQNEQPSPAAPGSTEEKAPQSDS